MNQRKISYSIAAILFIIGLFYAIRGHANEYDCFDYEAALSPSDARYYRDKKNHHQNEGIKSYERAHEKCWWLPRIRDRTMARSCFTTALTTATAGTPQSKIMAAITNLLITYGLSVMDEWDDINYNLMDAEYHFEMMEFYNDVLNKA